MTPHNNEYSPLLVNSQQQMEQYWPATSVLLQDFINKVTPGEQTIESMYNAILTGQSFLWIVKADTVDGPDVKLALTVEVVNYPKYSALRINALAGRELMVCAKKYWEFMQGWAYMIGVRAFEASVPPGLERLVGKLGLLRTKSCIHVRMPLLGKSDE